jgi:hypothetical protein
MLMFQAQVSQNPLLPKGGDCVHAIVSVIAARDESVRTPQKLAQAFLIDCSGSMEGDKIRQAKAALEATIDLLHDGAQFFIVAGSEVARMVFPLSPATTEQKRAAKQAVRQLTAGGGTAMSTWLEKALAEFRETPGVIHHALLLTDGKNESEPDTRLVEAVRKCEGHFQCDARGVGTDWKPDQIRLITNQLLGGVDIIARPEEITADFRKVVGNMQSKAIADVLLRVWTPVDTRIDYCKQVFPERLDLTSRAKSDPRTPQMRDYPTGAWGEEKRDYHLCIRVMPGNVGDRMLAGRVSLVVVAAGKERKVAEAQITALWTDDEAQSAVLNPSVDHYLKQEELADSIQNGLKARERGDNDLATRLLGRAVQLAAGTNPETLQLLRKVVEIVDEKKGIVKLLKSVQKEDEFALDTRSIKTSKARKED